MYWLSRSYLCGECDFAMCAKCFGYERRDTIGAYKLSQRLRAYVCACPVEPVAQHHAAYSPRPPPLACRLASKEQQRVYAANLADNWRLVLQTYTVVWCAVLLTVLGALIAQGQVGRVSTPLLHTSC